MEKQENIAITIAHNLVRYRKQANITQAQLAEKLNYSDKAVSKWERGEGTPDIFVLKQIADIYGIEIQELLERQDKLTFSRSILKNKSVIVILSTGLVWVVATFAYVLTSLLLPNKLEHTWRAFTYAIPVSFIVLLVFCCIWGKKIYRLILIDLLIWSLTLVIFLELNDLIQNMYFIFFIPIPVTILLLIWCIAESKRSRG